MVLTDTNILLRSIHPHHAHYAAAKSALNALRLRNEALCVAPQNLVEFWAVATRPRNENGLGLTTAQAANELTAIQDFFRVLPYTREVTRAWQRIVTTQAISGKQTHDAHLVAIMQVNSVRSILTFNKMISSGIQESPCSTPRSYRCGSLASGLHG
ncbi:MAG TPA: PIN domain-containing protein [Bryobacteraceae bacterium]